MGEGAILNISGNESSNLKPSLEQRVYSEKYTELNDFLQNIDPEVKTSQDLEKKIRNYFKTGLIAKTGFEKASEVYNGDLKEFDKSYYLLEKGQTPTLLHRYAKRIKKFNKTIMREELRNFENDIQSVSFKYMGQIKKKRKLTHFESLDYVLQYCKMKEVKTRNDVIEALMLAQVMGITKISIHRWDRRRINSERAGELTYRLFRRYNQGNKTEVYNTFKDKLSKRFGRTMSKSTFERYVKENKEPIKLIVEPDIPEAEISQSQAG